jgi:hypothetical protein
MAKLLRNATRHHRRPSKLLPADYEVRSRFNPQDSVSGESGFVRVSIQFSLNPFFKFCVLEPCRQNPGLPEFVKNFETPAGIFY